MYSMFDSFMEVNNKLKIVTFVRTFKPNLIHDCISLRLFNFIKPSEFSETATDSNHVNNLMTNSSIILFFSQSNVFIY